MSKESKILQQGHLDGFCLPYTVLNAFKTLVEPKSRAIDFAYSHAKEWKKLIALTPSLENFANGRGSDFDLRGKADVVATRNLIANYCEALRHVSRRKVEIESITIDEARKNDFSDSVLLFCLRDTAECQHHQEIDHWVCCINIVRNRLLLACSYTWHGYGGDYRRAEIEDMEHGRIHNNSLTKQQFGPENIYANSVHRISLRA